MTISDKLKTVYHCPEMHQRTDEDSCESSRCTGETRSRPVVVPGGFGTIANLLHPGRRMAGRPLFTESQMLVTY
jgi:hypothetical protein